MDPLKSGDFKKCFYTNNFDIIRLFAALQVVHVHLVTILGVPISDVHRLIFKFLGLFPGVPIFFFISGFLITKSWSNSHSLSDFFRKRALRIFPALIFSVLLALVLVVVSGYYITAGMGPLDLITIFISKVTFFQFYNPESLRGYGDGVLNGSLWTITVELQFYLLTPILFVFLHSIRRRLTFDLCLAIVFVIFFIISIYLKYFFLVDNSSVYKKLIKVSFLPWFYMFLMGALFQLHFNFFYKWLSGKLLLLLLIYIGAAAILFAFFRGGGADFGNLMNPALFPLLAALIFSAAYSKVELSERLLQGNDISYGAYIYHMPFINWVLYNNYGSTYLVAGCLFLFIIIFSICSWVFLERPILMLK